MSRSLYFVECPHQLTIVDASELEIRIGLETQVELLQSTKVKVQINCPQYSADLLKLLNIEVLEPG
ncbi:hypothetical protein Ciccas_014295, partial [Cichlidogyrus casuarinus]